MSPMSGSVAFVKYDCARSKIHLFSIVLGRVIAWTDEVENVAPGVLLVCY